MNLPYKALISLTILSSSCGVFGLFSQLFYSFRADEETYFELYTPQSPTEPQIFNLKNLSSLTASDKFDPSLEMRVLIPHRFLNITDSKRYFKKYSECGNRNYVHVNWAKGSDTHIRPIAALNLATVGEVVAKFITHVEERFSVDLGKLCIYSFGLGAGAAGEAGRRIGNVSCILALDPSMTIFSRNLHRDDAQYVQVIHSSSTYGTVPAIGDADFYINAGGYGLKQPGCSVYDLKCIHTFAENTYFNTLCKSKYTACRMHSKGDCGYAMGGEPLHVYKGEFEITVSD